MPYSIKAIAGLAVSDRRSVVFLLSDECDLNAESRFNAMNEHPNPIRAFSSVYFIRTVNKCRSTPSPVFGIGDQVI